ncbi:HK97 gp10 family phage protein [Humibacter ginsenosidimutans]|uniref:HK97 gp10 family phage protein n=1 Tax=Humibacter ginsenosidimutans TaxID=2599293 RepID=A0A5B8M6G5_9MICO|nr:HK97 gp10 family phage protein [Humibacter ginsenosidimutans]QDZ15781.1 HK97 gp10 family phage protein [Humibacter ginsenosidimutans]
MAGIEWNIDLSGLDRITEAMDNLVPAAVVKAAEHVRGVAADLTPVESGHLVGSAEVKATSHDSARVYYPGPYARYQHFELQLKHAHGQALYLEQPMITEAQACFRIMADTLRLAGL